MSKKKCCFSIYKKRTKTSANENYFNKFIHNFVLSKKTNQRQVEFLAPAFSTKGAVGQDSRQI